MCLYLTHRIKCDICRIIVRAHGHSECINHDIFWLYTVLGRSVIDFLRNRESSLCGIRNSCLIKCKSDDCSAVFLHQRKNLMHDFFLAVDGIDHRFAVIYTHCLFHRNRIRCVNLKRKRKHALQFIDRSSHHCRFIDLRKSYIDIQDMCSRISLFNALFENVFHIIITERLFEFGFAGRIDSLTDYDRSSSKFHCR